MSILSSAVEDFGKWTTFRNTLNAVGNSGVPDDIQNGDGVDTDHRRW